MNEKLFWRILYTEYTAASLVTATSHSATVNTTTLLLLLHGYILALNVYMYRRLNIAEF
jgi:hypothetical protein